MNLVWRQLKRTLNIPLRFLLIPHHLTQRIPSHRQRQRVIGRQVKRLATGVHGVAGIVGRVGADAANHAQHMPLGQPGAHFRGARMALAQRQ